MAYWWVSQNQTYRHERNGGYLWAPKQNEDGVSFHYWRSMQEVQPGDIVFSYVKKKIPAVSTVISKAVSFKRPQEFGGNQPWVSHGWRVDVVYRDLKKPLSIPTVANQLKHFLPNRYSPLTKKGTGVQGYLFRLPPQAGRFLVDQINATEHDEIEASIADAIENDPNVSTTEKVAISKSRIGQGKFREELIDYWDGACAVTGLNKLELLRAAHIKPWADSNNQERLDVFNGLLLSPSYDAAFDKGLITFSNDGRVVISEQLTAKNQARAGIDNKAQIRDLGEKHLKYLDHHRQEIFQKGN